MEINPCIKCVGSCCKLEVDVTRAEHKELVDKGHESAMVTNTDIFVKNNPAYESKKTFLDDMYSELFATILKDSQGFCVMLNRDTSLCSIYEDRPRVCRDYEINGKRCKALKKCTN